MTNRKIYEIKEFEKIEKNNRIYSLVKIKIPKLTQKKRTSLLNKIMNEKDLLIMIELWNEGNILSRPKEEVYYIFVQRKRKF